MFSFRKKYLALALAACFPGTAMAQCDDNASTAELTQCLGQELQRADAKLNAVYRKSLASMGDDAGAKANLLKSERAWVAYKEAQCFGVVGDMWAGGTGQSGAIAACQTGLTNLRIKELAEATRDGG